MTNSLEGIVIKCKCGAEENLGGIMDKGSLYQLKCYGHMPWLGRSNDNKGWYSDLPQGELCENELRVLQRGANNVYYPNIVSALTIPPYSSRIQKILASDLEILCAECEKPETLKMANLKYYFESNAARMKCDFEQFLYELEYAMGNVNQGITKIEEASWCSNDPICIDSRNQGYASLNYAACHACGLLPETSCECGNVLLDRGAIIGTTEDASIGYFAEFMKD